MTTSLQTNRETTFEPTAEQLARAAARRRFNWLAVYLPLLLATVVVLVLLVLMVWGVLAPMPEATRSFLSGVADLIVILVTLPLALVCGVVPLAIGGYLWQRRSSQSSATAVTTTMTNEPNYGRLQKLFWQLETLLVTTRTKSDGLLPKVAQPVIRGNALLAYVETMWAHFKALLRRSREKDER